MRVFVDFHVTRLEHLVPHSFALDRVTVPSSDVRQWYLGLDLKSFSPNTLRETLLSGFLGTVSFRGCQFQLCHSPSLSSGTIGVDRNLSFVRESFSVDYAAFFEDDLNPPNPSPSHLLYVGYIHDAPVVSPLIEQLGEVVSLREGVLMGVCIGACSEGIGVAWAEISKRAESISLLYSTHPGTSTLSLFFLPCNTS